jgi:hypothetical protein
MASVKITELSNVLGSQINPSVDVLPIVRVGANSTDKITVEELGTLFGGGGLEGTQYVFVAANGTDIENAAELQTAYNLAVTKATPIVTPTNIPLSNVTDNGGGNYNMTLTNSSDASYFSTGGTYDIIINGTSYQVIVQGIMGNMLFLMNLTPGLSFSSFTLEVTTYPKVTVIAAPGNYNFENSTFIMDTEYVSLVSLDGNRSIIFNSSDSEGTLWLLANNVYLKGVDVQTKSLSVASGLNKVIVENCKGGNYSFGFGGNISGTYINCEGGDYSFASMPTSSAPVGVYGNSGDPLASGTFINCVAGGASFGAAFMVSAEASGIFTNCSSINGSSFGFSFNSSIASGTFTDCVAGVQSFGAGSGGAIASGVFRRCIAGFLSFAKNALMSGKFYYCEMSDTFSIPLVPGVALYCIEEVVGSSQPFNSGFTAQNNV